MPVRKRKFKNGVKWSVDVKLPNGRRYSEVIGTKKQAEKVQKRLEAEIVEGKWDVRDVAEISFSQFTSVFGANMCLHIKGSGFGMESAAA